MEEETASTESPKSTGRRRASRAAGPAGEVTASTGVPVDAPKIAKVRLPKPVGPPPRRQPHRSLVAWVSLATAVVVSAALGVAVLLTVKHQDGEEAKLAQTQLFVDTASQYVVNMFSYTQNTIDADVNRFVNGTSGPLRDMMSQGNNADNLKLLFRDTQRQRGGSHQRRRAGEDRRPRQSSRCACGGAGYGHRSGRKQSAFQAVPPSGDRGTRTTTATCPPTTSSTPTAATDDIEDRQADRCAVDRCWRCAFVALAGVGGWFYWTRVEIRGEKDARDILADKASEQIPKVFGYDYQTVERSLNDVYPLLTPTTARSSRTARTRTSSRRRGNGSWSVRPTWSAWEC